ncbi:MAG TPA: LPS export ABC transporter permease LptG [Nevskiaceae bacterium]
MARIDRYLVRNVFAMSALSGFVLVSMYTFVVLVADMGRLGTDGFSVRQLLSYAALSIPGNTYILLPVIALLGTLLGLGHLAHHNELLVVRSTGASWWRVAATVVVGGIGLALLGFVLGNWLAPAGQHMADEIRQGRPASLGQLHWLRDGDDVVRIGGLRGTDDIENLSVYAQAPDHQLTGILSARSGHYADGQWQLQDVTQTVFGADGVRVEHHAHEVWRSGVTPNVLKLFVLENGDLSVWGLGNLIGYLHHNALSAQKYEILLWRKLVEPFSVLAMMLLAVPFAVAPKLRSSGVGQRLLIGVVIGIGFYILDKVAVSLAGVYDWPAALSAAAPTFLLALIGAWRLSRLR